MLLKKDYYKVNKISLKKTLSYIIRDNMTRLKLMSKEPTLSNKVWSILSPNMMAIIIYRLSHYFHCKNIKLFSKFFYVLNIVLFGCDISPPSEIGPGLYIDHVVGIAIHAKIGNNARIFGQVGLGGRGDRASDKGWLGGPIISDNVTFGYGSKVLGYVKIGSNVFIGAMSMVTKSLPDNAVAVGIPAKISNAKRPTCEDDDGTT